MLIGRCAWHLKYRGYPAFDGVRSWRGFWVRFTDGICPDCAERFRAEHRDFLERRRDDVIVARRGIHARSTAA